MRFIIVVALVLAVAANVYAIDLAKSKANVAVPSTYLGLLNTFFTSKSFYNCASSPFGTRYAELLSASFPSNDPKRAEISSWAKNGFLQCIVQNVDALLKANVLTPTSNMPQDSHPACAVIESVWLEAHTKCFYTKKGFCSFTETNRFNLGAEITQSTKRGSPPAIECLYEKKNRAKKLSKLYVSALKSPSVCKLTTIPFYTVSCE